MPVLERSAWLMTALPARAVRCSGISDVATCDPGVWGGGGVSSLSAQNDGSVPGVLGEGLDPVCALWRGGWASDLISPGLKEGVEYIDSSLADLSPIWRSGTLRTPERIDTFVSEPFPANARKSPPLRLVRAIENL